MGERGEKGGKENLSFEINSLKELAREKGGLTAPGRAETQLWNIARIDENKNLVFLIRTEGGTIERKENLAVKELYELNFPPTEIESAAKRDRGEIVRAASVYISRTGAEVKGEIEQKGEQVEVGKVDFFSNANNFLQILQLIDRYPIIDERISGVRDLVKEIKEDFEAGILIEAEDIRKITRTEGLRDAVLRAMSPEFLNYENLYDIKAKLIEVKVQHEKLEEGHVIFLKDSSGDSLSEVEHSSGLKKIDLMIKTLDILINLLERDSKAEIQDNDSVYRVFTSSYNLRESVKRAVKILTAKTDVTSTRP